MPVSDATEATLVILPNWMGDVVMSAALLALLGARSEGSAIHVAVPDHLAELAALLPGVTDVHGFEREACRGPLGAFRLGRRLRRFGPFGSCYCLPRSFRSAITAFATGAGDRIGYRQEMRAFLLTRAHSRRPGVHRVVEYARLASESFERARSESVVRIETARASALVATGLAPERPAIALDIHSEAQSRRMSLEKWARVAGALSSDIGGSFVLIGSPREAARTREFLSRLPASVRVRDLCGRTSSGQLAGVLASCDVLLSSDSGPAHLANALGVPTVVLFGAGDDRITEPFNPAGRQVIRLPGLECAPCVANRCRLGTPRCLEDLDERVIVRAVAAALDSRG